MLPRAYRLPSPLILEVSGRHAERYLHARLSNNIKAQRVGDTIFAAALNAQGRTEGYFSVSRVSVDRFWLVCDGGDHQEISAALKRFVVADQITFQDRSTELALLHIWPATDLPEATLSYVHTRFDRPGRDFLIGQDQAARILADSTRVSFVESAEAAFIRISAGQVAFPDELSGRLFLESRLNHAISFTKGCYVGQEVNERLDSHGKLPRVLVAARLSGSRAAPGDQVLHLSTRVGEVVSVAHAASQTVLFCSLRTDVDCLNLTVNDQPLELIDVSPSSV